jgi:hypothetical protein
MEGGGWQGAGSGLAGALMEGGGCMLAGLCRDEGAPANCTPPARGGPAWRLTCPADVAAHGQGSVLGIRAPGTLVQGLVVAHAAGTDQGGAAGDVGAGRGARAVLGSQQHKGGAGAAHGVAAPRLGGQLLLQGTVLQRDLRGGVAVLQAVVSSGQGWRHATSANRGQRAVVESVPVRWTAGASPRCRCWQQERAAHLAAATGAWSMHMREHAGMPQTHQQEAGAPAR